MPTIVGVRLRFSSKVLSFDPAGKDPEPGDIVIVETERGSEIGEVVEASHEVAQADLVTALKPVLRIATDSDIAHGEDLKRLEDEARPEFRRLVKQHKLDMKPIDVEFLFDGSKIVFYFSAEERVDFRELVRDLAARFKARIDMRQVGVRDEARMVGGIGHCGQILCCERFPGEFQPVSIRMAKEQDLPLNPLKISGLCGRLMCCLRYEYDAYKDFKSRAPKRRAIIETPLGLAKVMDLNTPKETVSMRLEDGQQLTVPLCGMACGKEGGRPCSVKREALEDAGVIMPIDADSLAESAPVAEQPQSKRRRGDGSRGGSKDSGGASKDRKGGSRETGDSKKPEADQAKSGGSKSGGSKSGGSKSGGSKSGSRSGGSKSRRDGGAKDKAGQDSQGAAADKKSESSSSPSPGRRRRRRRTSGGDAKDSGTQQS